MGRPKSTDPIGDFWAKVNICGQDECWEWTASLAGGAGCDYGQFWYEGHRWLAHRLSYTLEVGDIPDGMEIGHTCANFVCQNPRHLIVATHQENQRRGKSMNINPTCELCGQTPAHETEFLHGDILLARIDLCNNCAELDDVLETLQEQTNFF